MFKPEVRSIYKYWNGDKEVYGDPMTILMRFNSAPIEGFNFEVDCKLLQVQCPQTLPAFERLIKVARFTFNLAEYSEIDGKPYGVVDNECLQIMLEFWEWVDAQKKSTGPRPTWLQLMEQDYSATSTTPPTLDSGSTETEPCSEPAFPPSTPSPLPSVANSQTPC